MFAASKTAAITTAANWVEECFSVYLYTGNGSTQTITNGIDLSGKGGMVWLKRRDTVADNLLLDTVRGGSQLLFSNLTSASTGASLGWSFNSNGFNFTSSSASTNASGGIYASWTFREQAKFFDVVTYTGTGVARTVAHNLGSVPGCIIVKRTDTTGSWNMYHRSLANTQFLALNLTDAAATATSYWNSTTPTSTEFTLGAGTGVNASGGTYVAYLFAHDAGGFGASGTDNVISCGSSVGGGSAGTVSVNLGYEPQWVLLKNASNASFGGWELIDNMRGWPVSSAGENYLFANSSAAEATGGYWTGNPTATGFTHYAYAGETYIYIAIRRGPMKTPTSGTSVFSPQLQTPTGSSSYVMAANSGFPVDWLPTKKTGTVGDWFQTSRLTNNYLSPNTTAAEGTFTYGFDRMAGVSAAWDPFLTVSYAFRRAPGFFDVVCYTGTGVTDRVVTHNLGVAPELIITKSRSSADAWAVGTSFGVSSYQWLYLNLTNSALSLNYSAKSRINSQPTSTQYVIATDSEINGSGLNYVAYLFATVAGVSKVGSYTGNGSNQTINCGFTAGARFVMIKRTSSTGDWYVWDTARGIVSGNDPRLSLNSTAAEVTTDDSIDPDNSGFIVNQLSATNINVSSATYIYLAIA